MLEQRIETQKERKVLYQTDHLEIILIDWRNTSLSEMHNHGFSQCRVFIEDGVFENSLKSGTEIERQIYMIGQMFETPLGLEHQMRCLSETGRTLHIYSPPIKNLE